MTCHHQDDLRGRAALITGANRGLGLEIARAFVASGASVMLCARDMHELEHAGRELSARALNGQIVRWQPVDVTITGQVSAVVATTLRELGHLHVLVSNAGLNGPFGRIEEVDWAEWRRTIEVNLFGSVNCIRAVLPHLKQQKYGKIVQLSGGGATSPMPQNSAYAASKAAIVRFAETIAKECQGYGIDVNSIAPGALNTRMLDDLLAAGAAKVGADSFARAMRQKEEGGAPMAQAVELAVFLASRVSNGITGRLISAVWDEWPTWPDHLAELQAGDAYTLRRITGRDRGFNWGDR
jgi:NAD(P)-dependent dehydrogenase (short-subunit alcohol dehydrogenase family)